MTEVELANAERNATALIERIDRDANGPFGMAANTMDAQLRDMAQGILALVAEVQRFADVRTAINAYNRGDHSEPWHTRDDAYAALQSAWRHISELVRERP